MGNTFMGATRFDIDESIDNLVTVKNKKNIKEPKAKVQ